jgi:hypothetical protein
MILATHGIIPSITAATTAYIAQYEAVLEYAADQGWGPPTLAQQIIQNNLMVSLVSSNIFTNLDALYILATNGSQEFSRINWISPGSNNLTASGAPAPKFEPNLGWKVESTGGYMDTNFKFTGNSPQKLRQTGGSAFAWINQSANGFFLGHAGTTGGNGLTLRFNNQNNQNNRMMTNANSLVNINFSGNGLKAGYSTAVNTQKYYSDNNPVLSTQTRASQGPDTQNNVSLFRSANNYATAGQRVALFGFGGNIESSHSDLFDYLNTYMTNRII